MKLWQFSLAVLLAASPLSAPAEGKEPGGSSRGFATAEEAAAALAAAYKSGDRAGLLGILGPAGEPLVASGDPVEERIEREWFVDLYEEAHEIEAESDSRAVLEIGKHEQPFPVPIVKLGNQWRFDPSEGHQDLLDRRMSKNELSALEVVLACVEAEREYHSEDRNGDGILEYAQRFASSPGKRDGLYWEHAAGETPNVAARFAAALREEGYSTAPRAEPQPYRGYYFKILTAQGPHAPGGARDYLSDGRMVGGFALVAFPARYGVSGIMTFLVNQEGVVYQKDLGRRTGELARKIVRFDPDASWTRGAAPAEHSGRGADE